ncbi:MAG: phosphatidate cytidylyltransferase [Alcanivorax sp.]
MSSSLFKRILSAVLIAPPFIFCIAYGDIYLAGWLFIAFILSVGEWYNLAKKLDHFFPIMFLGVVYMAISYSSFLALREVYSPNMVIIFLGMIWFSDIGAYFVGKTFGGPKLIQQISPNKTWSGFGGALFFPALFAVIWVSFMGIHPEFHDNPWYILYLIAATLGVVIGSVGQAGDLLVSFVKRQANVKDTGALIPGHGGLLDRIDSMLLGAPVFLVLITLLSYVF